jgi:3-methyladenine DNA glycosylase AlkD
MLARLQALADPVRAAHDRAYHKADRPYLGIPVPALDPFVAEGRALPLPDRLRLADALWASNIHDARIAAGKMLIQARVRPDDALWAQLLAWLPAFDAWAIADTVTSALNRRLAADPSRIAVVAGWTTDPNMWVRRAALVVCQPFFRLRHPGPDDLMIRDAALDWCVAYLPDRQWFIHKAIGAVLRDLGRHDPERARVFMAAHGDRLMGVARREAGKNIG